MNRPAQRSMITWGAVLIIGLGALLLPAAAAAHCDTLDGPVVADARAALAKGEVTPVLKWVAAEAEPELRAAFASTLAVRTLSPAAAELADRYFFETLVRIHRAGEGAPYTGLKPAGSVVPVIAKADQALANGSVEALAKTIAGHAEAGITERFRHAVQTRQHAQESVAAGRDYVAAYVTYVHYLEGIVQAVHAAAHHGDEPAAAAHQH